MIQLEGWVVRSKQVVTHSITCRLLKYVPVVKHGGDTIIIWGYVFSVLFLFDHSEWGLV